MIGWNFTFGIACQCKLQTFWFSAKNWRKMFSLSNTWEFRNSLFNLWFPPMVTPMICPGSHSWTELYFSWEQIISHVETGTVITNISVTGSSHVCVTQVGCFTFQKSIPKKRLIASPFVEKRWCKLHGEERRGGEYSGQPACKRIGLDGGLRGRLRWANLI